jgi:hypothetical protein
MEPEGSVPFVPHPKVNFQTLLIDPSSSREGETSFLKIGFQAFGQRKEVMPHDG